MNWSWVKPLSKQFSFLGAFPIYHVVWYSTLACISIPLPSRHCQTFFLSGIPTRQKDDPGQKIYIYFYEPVNVFPSFRIIFFVFTASNFIIVNWRPAAAAAGYYGKLIMCLHIHYLLLMIINKSFLLGYAAYSSFIWLSHATAWTQSCNFFTWESWSYCDCSKNRETFSIYRKYHFSWLFTKAITRVTCINCVAEHVNFVSVAHCKIYLVSVCKLFNFMRACIQCNE